MKQKASSALAYASALVGLTLATAAGAVVTFESVPLGIPNGPSGVWNGQAGGGALTINGVTFSNNYNASFSSWNGFSFSNKIDATSPGFGNQYSAYPGGGADDSSQYGVSFGNGASITFASSMDLSGLGASITNTTYAGLAMLNGDAFSKKFGGILGNDPDFFRLTISGYSGGTSTGTFVDFYLADFRPENNSLDYIVDEWTNVDFSPLGVVDQIRFSYASSDVGAFGINTPTYFAIDNLLITIPEPSSSLLALLGGVALLRRRRCS
jgi:hypothetical protein